MLLFRSGTKSSWIRPWHIFRDCANVRPAKNKDPISVLTLIEEEKDITTMLKSEFCQPCHLRYMSDFYADGIRNGAITMKDLPERFRKRVKRLLTSVEVK